MIIFILSPSVLFYLLKPDWMNVHVNTWKSKQVPSIVSADSERETPGTAANTPEGLAQTWDHVVLPRGPVSVTDLYLTVFKVNQSPSGFHNGMFITLNV